MINWDKFKGLPKSICICKMCCTVFMSYATVDYAAPRGLETQDPCPKCGCRCARSAQSQPEEFTLSEEDVGEIS